MNLGTQTKLIHCLKNSSELLHQKTVFAIELTPINYLNTILEYSSQEKLKDIFGYLRLNFYHLELVELLKMINIQKSLAAKEGPKIDYHKLEHQE